MKGKSDIERDDYESLNEDIHMRIWDASDNEKLKRYLMGLWNGPSTGHSVEESSEHYRASTLEHIDILTAIAQQHPQQARDAMTAHITRSMINILRKYPE